MSTCASILYHRDEERKIDIHIYEELIGDSPQDIRLEIEFDHAVINVPWPLGLSLEQVQKLAIQPDPDRKWFWENNTNPATVSSKRSPFVLCAA